MTKKLKKYFLASFYFFSLQEDEEEERIFLKKKHFLSNWQAATDSPFTFHNLTAKITSRLIMWVLTSLETDDAVDLLQMTTPEAIWRFKTTPTPTTSISRSRSLSSSWPSLLSLLSSWRHCRRCRRLGVTAVVAVVVVVLVKAFAQELMLIAVFRRLAPKRSSLLFASFKKKKEDGILSTKILGKLTDDVVLQNVVQWSI